jgi:hypothetical protein
MRVLCVSLPLLLVVSASTCLSQESGLVNAPEAAMDATNVAKPGVAAIVPVRQPIMKGEKLNAFDWSLLGAVAGLRFLDYRTTVQFTRDPAHFREVELPAKLVDNRPALAAFEASTVVADYFVYRALVVHHHQRVARFGSISILVRWG